VIDSARRLVACCHQDLLVEQVERRPRGSESSFPSRDVRQSLFERLLGSPPGRAEQARGSPLRPGVHGKYSFLLAELPSGPARPARP